MVDKARKLLIDALALLAQIVRREDVAIEDVENCALDIGEHLAGNDPENN